MKNTTLILAILASLLLSTSATAADKEDALFFPFFRDNGQTGVYLAMSRDGLNFTPLNNDQPIMPPTNWPAQNLTRDPSIVYHDGLFHMVWTSGWKGRVFGYAQSRDLVKWSEPVKVQPFPESLPPADQPQNVWAPEIHWDPIQKNFAIIWSSTTDRESRNGDGSSSNNKDGSLDHRFYISRTADGKTFTDARLLFDPKFCCIDVQLAFDAGSTESRWIAIFKHEKEIPLGGKNLRLAFASPDLAKWSPVSDPIVGPGSTLRPREMAEGPTLIKWAGQWHLYWDAFANKHYSLATSPDLKNWTDRTPDLRMPPHPRHGTIFSAPRSAVGW